jgi:hypothetical protein
MEKIILHISLVAVSVFMPLFCCETSSAVTASEHHLGQAISLTGSHDHSHDSGACVCCSGTGAVSKIETYNSLLQPRFYALRANTGNDTPAMTFRSAISVNTSFLISESPPAVPFYIQVNSLLI